MKRAWVILTGEYPPQPGGVSDYTRLVALGLASAGDDVHVWCPALPANECEESIASDPGVMVHRLPDHFGKAGLAVLGRELNALPTPFRLLLQYVPHAFGCRAMNLRFCLWLGSHRRHELWTMFHEVAFPWVKTPLKHNFLAAVHRVMAIIVARSSQKIFVSTPGWNALLSPLVPGGHPIVWTPVPSNVPTEVDAGAVAALRVMLADAACGILGYFGSYGGPILPQLEAVLPRLLADDPRRTGLLLGRGGDAYARDFIARNPRLRGRVAAPGSMPPPAVAKHLAACDLLLLPYPDGASSRRSSLMAALALGVPTLTTAGPATEPLWRQSAAVELVPAGDPEAFVSKANELLLDPARRKALGAAGASLYRQRFGIDRTIATLRACGQAGCECPMEAMA